MEEELTTTVVEEEELSPIDELLNSSAEGETVEVDEVLGPAQFPAPYRSQIGKSTVDLSIPENLEQQKADYDEFWNYGKKRGFLGIPYTSEEFKGERDKLKDK